MAPTSNSKKTPRAPKGDADQKGLDIGGVHEHWESSPEIRGRLRDGGFVMHPQSGLNCDNAVCTMNKQLLLPILAGMFGDDRKLPAVGQIRSELACLYKLSKRVGPDVEQSIAGDAIHIRKLLSFVKAKCRRLEVSTDFCLLQKSFDPFAFLLSSYKPDKAFPNLSPANDSPRMRISRIFAWRSIRCFRPVRGR